MTDFDDPGTGGDQLPLNDLNGALLLIAVLEETDPIETKFGPNTAIRADIAVLDGAKKGNCYDDTLIFPRVLKSSLRGKENKRIVARLGQGPAQQGKSPPWVLNPATAEEKETARKYLAYVEAQKPKADPFGDAEEPF
jgi:hypothetical protein